MPRVQIEGLGTVDFPDGTSPEDMERLSNQALMEKNTGHPATGMPEGTSAPDPITGNTELANKVSLWEGLKGAAKGALGTVHQIHDFNAPSDPRNSMYVDQDKYPGSDVNTTASNGDQMAGKAAETGLEMLAGGGGKAAEAIEALPSTRRAGAVLGSIRDAAKDVPVSLTHAAEPMQRLAELGNAGHTIPTVFDKLLNRSQMVGDIKFPEARDFYSSMARPSIMERMTTSPEAQATMGKLKSAFTGDLADAANTLSPPRGDEYRDALSEYRNAKRIQKVAMGTGAAAATAAAKGVGLGAALHVLGKVGGQ